jgi:hypothetical protein
MCSDVVGKDLHSRCHLLFYPLYTFTWISYRNLIVIIVQWFVDFSSDAPSFLSQKTASYLQPPFITVETGRLTRQA